jgi:hypothetical protein
MSELRARALSAKPADLGLSQTEYAATIWGVLMETGLPDGAAYTLVVLADGSTSLYFSTGGGVIGAGAHARVRAASTALLHEASQVRASARSTTSTPLPKPGQVVFYLLAANGTLAYGAAEESLGAGKDQFSPLFFAGHAVIAEVRKSEQGARGPTKK